MGHRNTLKTRLLPLSILVSSLISGGAMAASTPTFIPGATLGIANGGSFIVRAKFVWAPYWGVCNHALILGVMKDFWCWCWGVNSGGGNSHIFVTGLGEKSQIE